MTIYNLGARIRNNLEANEVLRKKNENTLKHKQNIDFSTLLMTIQRWMFGGLDLGLWDIESFIMRWTLSERPNRPDTRKRK